VSSLTGLTTLNLAGSKVTSEGLQTLSSLTTLTLWSCPKVSAP
jgi:Leucine-rich repeat (LRR) protein